MTAPKWIGIYFDANIFSAKFFSPLSIYQEYYGTFLMIITNNLAFNSQKSLGLSSSDSKGLW